MQCERVHGSWLGEISYLLLKFSIKCGKQDVKSFITPLRKAHQKKYIWLDKKRDRKLLQ